MNQITQSMKIAVWLVVCSITVMSCSDDDEPQTRQVNLTVQNEVGMAIETASVTLYTTIDDWAQEQNSISPSQTTSAEGQVQFSDLEPGTYYVDIQKDGATNWSTQTTFSQPETFGETDVTIKIGVSQLDVLVGKVSKEYAYTDLRIDDISLFAEVDACEKDDTFEFVRAGQSGSEKENALTCEEGAPGDRTFSWSLTANGELLTIDYPDGESLEYTVVSLTDSRLVISSPIELEGQIFNAEFYFVTQ